MKTSLDRFATILLLFTSVTAALISTVELGGGALVVALAMGVLVSALVGTLAWTREDHEVRRGKSQAERCDDRSK
jgi:uncharacterized membrane protein YidH (DUF202 family)